ncbi:hypothetical protein B0H17DRAFT_1215913 [Mycena rosella]|uniref:Uncharacterized protein n=1 Tax=Mycena rosella TaxID=1033263 RepID=A0AAD7FZF0_MYCRO|nr:hypothetical protein B0H17DRAFT_1215913 [Mycena rosella]
MDVEINKSDKTGRTEGNEFVFPLVYNRLVQVRPDFTSNVETLKGESANPACTRAPFDVATSPPRAADCVSGCTCACVRVHPPVTAQSSNFGIAPTASTSAPLPPAIPPTPSLRAPPQHPQYASCDMPRGHSCMYAPPLPHACYDDRYEHHRHPHSPRPTRMTLRTQNGGQIVHTDDAATKLSDRLRCFNCCTTDTSAWRCYNLSPALQQMRSLRAHAHAPAPEQFPHKRSSLTSSTLCSCSPPHNKHR